MSLENTIRTWKDENFRNSLSEKERTLLPEHPAGVIELTDAELSAAAGGRYGDTGDGACSHTPNCL